MARPRTTPPPADSPAGMAPSLGLQAEELEVYRLIAPATHTHADIELNLVRRGEIDYLIGGRTARVPAGRLCLFWAGMPHWIRAAPPGTSLLWTGVPLTQFLRWRLPEAFVARLLGGALVEDVEPPQDIDDLALLGRWVRDLGTREESLGEIVSTEIEARLRRFARAQLKAGNPERPAAPHPVPAVGDDPTHDEIFAQVASRIERGCLTDEPMQALLEGLSLSSDYVARLFRRRCGLRPVEYRTRLRLAHAQRLLITTGKSIVEIAFESGFGSLNRFHVEFHRVCGETPRRYRQNMT